ncbi:hypothetical protein CXF92_18535 [Pseudomonas sp. Choline-3u-10]|uniref:Putative Arc repressor family protein n=1 Tax=viral metagenome TaxID=1070528 RepID=A0A6H1ZKQ4_9ZZZZ|nr:MULTISPECIES: Arc family DNA-binding protein [Pseudomonadaceae]MBK3797539.1 Arc family DNA-binding protein [Stutzerimonas stutzeri]MBK3876378.1 Arc family DNA-binding protein [Stutzerimonas stutzeri]PKG90915.1 hypothetical protein CXF92_18535 [Pseudomonas sp. Choline-3u-10]
MNRREIAPFGFRIRPEVKEAAKEQAERNRRSLNTELELLVEEGLERRKMQVQARA